MRGAYRDSVKSGPDQGECSCALRTESTDRLELRYLGSHSADDSPTAEIGPQRDSQIRRKNDGIVEGPPVGLHLLLSNVSTRKDGASDDAHCLLCVVAAVGEANSGRGDELQPAEPAVDLTWRFTLQDP